MRTKSLIPITAFLLLIVSIPLLVVDATPTLNWSVDSAPGTDVQCSSDILGHVYTSIEAGAPKLVVRHDGSVWSTLRCRNGGSEQDDDDVSFMYSTGGARLDSLGIKCNRTTGNDQCFFQSDFVDNADQFLVIESSQRGNGQYLVADTPRPPGELCMRTKYGAFGGCWNITANTTPTVPVGTTMGPRGLGSVKLNSTSMAYVAQANSASYILRTDDDLDGSSDWVSSQSGAGLTVNTSGNIGWTEKFSAGTLTLKRYDLSTGTVTHSQAISLTSGGVPDTNALRHTTGKLIIVYGRSGTQEIGWAIMLQSTGAQVGGQVIPTGSQIFEGGSVRNTGVNDFQSDNHGTVLVCGTYTNVEQRGYVALFNTTTNAQVWNITYDLGSATSANSCRFDNQGGFYVQLLYTDSLSVKRARLLRYEGSDFENPVTLDVVTVPVPPGFTSSPPGTNTDAAVGFKNFCLLNGFESGASKFLCGFVYVASATILVGAIMSAISDRKATMIGSGITALCMMVFVSLPEISLWPAGVMVVLVIACAAFITWRLRDTFIQRG